jgi:hypothetical protein
MSLRPWQIRAKAQDTATMVAAVGAIERRYRELRMPVVIMAVTNDRIVDHRRHADRLHQTILQSTLQLVPGVGHMLHHAVPQQVGHSIEASANRPTHAAQCRGRGRAADRAQRSTALTRCGPFEVRHAQEQPQQVQLRSGLQVSPEGLSFPFDFGFVPSTLGEDGDPRTSSSRWMRPLYWDA